MYCTGDVFKSNADPTLTFVLPPLLSAALSQTSDHITTFLVWRGTKEKETTDKELCSNYQTCKFPICIPSEIIGPESDHWLCLSLTHSLTNSLLFSKLDRCDPGVWRCQLKTCLCCNCCWLGSCWSSVSQSSFDFSVFRALQSCQWQRQWQRDKDSFLDLERFSDLLTITDSHLTIR